MVESRQGEELLGGNPIVGPAACFHANFDSADHAAAHFEDAWGEAAVLETSRILFTCAVRAYGVPVLVGTRQGIDPDS